jgi:hypothetical protein
MKPYQLILKNEKLKYYNVIGDLIALLNLICFIYMAISSTDSLRKTIFILLISIIVVHYLLIFYLRYKVKFTNWPHRSVFLLCAIGWARSPYWWISIILIVLLFLDIPAHRKLKLIVSENKIDYPSFPRRVIEWNELTNLVLKDGLITIDFKNNKIIQQTILNSDISEQEFNNFCRKQLNK